jgi:hypothetical protein
VEPGAAIAEAPIERTETIRKMVVPPWKRLNAAPRFCACQTCTTSPRSSALSPTARLETTTALVAWSATRIASAVSSRTKPFLNPLLTDP